MTNTSAKRPLSPGLRAGLRAAACRAKTSRRSTRPAPPSSAVCRLISPDAAISASAVRAGPSTCPPAPKGRPTPSSCRSWNSWGWSRRPSSRCGSGGAATPFQARRYRLTSAGHRLYLDRDTGRPAAPDDARAPERADLCFATVTLDKVARWEIQKEGPATTALVSYTYHADAPAVARDPRLGRAFPAVARLLAGDGKAELVEGFTLTSSGWTANELLQRQAGATGAQAVAP